MTTAPAAATRGANSREDTLPAENSTMERPVKSAVAASSTVTWVSPHGRVRPADRAEANSRNCSTGNWRSARTERMTPPT
jgi:hypothetical protein